ncbi:hypothetical protein BaRGS_00009510 [Batillaria attramentaria]|uniref:Uncharacterized protein n=1 Tax=Batillaria attramentaria TaxID=370345 RepID=A0ABD0LIF4_9CAEN
MCLSKTTELMTLAKPVFRSNSGKPRFAFKTCLTKKGQMSVHSASFYSADPVHCRKTQCACSAILLSYPVELAAIKQTRSVAMFSSCSVVSPLQYPEKRPKTICN